MLGGNVKLSTGDIKFCLFQKLKTNQAQQEANINDYVKWWTVNWGGGERETDRQRGQTDRLTILNSDDKIL